MNAARHSSHQAASADTRADTRAEDRVEEPAGDLADQQRRGHRLRFELIFASLWLAFGLFVLPALIFWVGNALLGAYGENAGLGTFYVDFYGDLADGSGRAWTLALGPLLMIYLLRAIFIGTKSGHGTRADLEDEIPSPPRRAPPKKEPARRAPTRTTRVEPRMGGE